MVLSANLQTPQIRRYRADRVSGYARQGTELPYEDLDTRESVHRVVYTFVPTKRIVHFVNRAVKDIGSPSQYSKSRSGLLGGFTARSPRLCRHWRNPFSEFLAAIKRWTIHEGLFALSLACRSSDRVDLRKRPVNSTIRLPLLFT